MDPANTRRARNIAAGNDKVALVIDDLASVSPWSPRYLRVYGTAELVERRNQFGLQQVMKVTPGISWSANLSGRPLSERRGRVGPHRTVHQGGSA
jgi:pyridoxamine 5'-phosphate oxidase family protein